MTKAREVAYSPRRSSAERRTQTRQAQRISWRALPSPSAKTVNTLYILILYIIIYRYIYVYIGTRNRRVLRYTHTNTPPRSFTHEITAAISAAHSVYIHTHTHTHARTHIVPMLLYTYRAFKKVWKRSLDLYNWKYLELI